MKTPLSLILTCLALIFVSQANADCYYDDYGYVIDCDYMPDPNVFELTISGEIDGIVTGTERGSGTAELNDAFGTLIIQYETLTEEYIGGGGLLLTSFTQTYTDTYDLVNLTGVREISSCIDTPGLITACQSVMESPIELLALDSASEVIGGFNIDFSFMPSRAGNGAINIAYQVSPVPVPGAAWLFGSALLGLAAQRRIRSK